MITGADPEIAILIMGVFSIAYTVFGGIAAIITGLASEVSEDISVFHEDEKNVLHKIM